MGLTYSNNYHLELVAVETKPALRHSITTKRKAVEIGIIYNSLILASSTSCV